MSNIVRNSRRPLSDIVAESARRVIYLLLYKNKRSARIRKGSLAGCTIFAPFEERLAFGLGTYEPDVAAAFEPLAKNGAVVYDIGAHIGFFSMLASKKGARVFAFEANPANVELLKTNLDTNSFTAATVMSMAVSDHTGTLSFATFGYSLVGSIAGANTASDATLIEVPCTSLDEFVGSGANPAPSLIKIDVEGAEGLVVAGAMAVLAESKPVLIVEIHSEEQRKIVFGLTEPIGYQWRRLSGSTMELGTDEVGQFIGEMSA